MGENERAFSFVGFSFSDHLLIRFVFKSNYRYLFVRDDAMLCIKGCYVTNPGE